MKSLPSAKGFIPGLVVLALGVLFLLHNFDVLRLWDLWLYWPLILIAAGLHWAPDRRSRALGIAAIGVGIAQGYIGSAGLGLLAERPGAFGQVLIYLVIPETLIIFGFVIAFFLNNQIG